MKLDVKYETGVVWQDFQHKQLIDLFEKIKEARSDNKDKNLYRYTIAFLAMYVNHHFKLEEEYMDKYTYPDTALHRKEHQEFIKEIKAFREENINYSEKGADELLTRMGEWILSHILENDQKLGEYIRSFEQKKSAS
ncbi:MAG: hemerythrin family protein [Proteobacteria bacterium]|nr:hemerythrin family protein [Pseudomonadota bacterium]MBU1581864.1 hemerythrin family protein [Pseudomonadota bacterium]MBU2453640.1 hemerythrin family protein [Pseudomonadota bacterium]MBU2631480.1 hemerythrin family protein [Pseudomonadota bacterium]